MPRPIKCRRVLALPTYRAFAPEGIAQANRDDVTLTIDEFEAIRLIDHEGLSQEECSQSMDVGRTTVQQIYENARKKIALALVDGRRIRIQGGAYCPASARGKGFMHGGYRGGRLYRDESKDDQGRE